jgi:hypothetical protein
MNIWLKRNNNLEWKLLVRKNNNLLDVDLTWRGLARVETEQKMDKIVKRLKVTEEKNLELHIVISEIDY